jgi:hypothetical protein
MNQALINMPKETAKDILDRYVSYKKVSASKRAEHLMEFLMYLYDMTNDEELTLCFIKKETIDNPLAQYIMLQAVKRQCAKRGA